MKKNVYMLSGMIGIIVLILVALNFANAKKVEKLSETQSVEIYGVTESEIAGLIQMREEEKLARDVYITLGEIWGAKSFSNISASEQTHTDAVKTLLNRYTISDPVVNDTVGVFASKAIQDLYNELVTKGKVSLTDAFIVGATIEDLDIYDLEILKSKTDKADILAVYTNLQNGSRNHLRAFVKNIQANGGVYTPRYISQSEYTSIITASQGRVKY